MIVGLSACNYGVYTATAKLSLLFVPLPPCCPANTRCSYTSQKAPFYARELA